MTIRSATIEDIPILLEIAERHHRKSHWRGIVDFDETSVRDSFELFVGADSVHFLVSECGGQIVGFIAVIEMPLYFNAKARTAQELCWYCESPTEAFALLSEAESRVSRCSLLMIGAQAGPAVERFERVYARKGFEPFTRGYLKVLSNGH